MQYANALISAALTLAVKTPSKYASVVEWHSASADDPVAKNQQFQVLVCRSQDGVIFVLRMIQDRSRTAVITGTSR